MFLSFRFYFLSIILCLSFGAVACEGGRDHSPEGARLEDSENKNKNEDGDLDFEGDPDLEENSASIAYLASVLNEVFSAGIYEGQLSDGNLCRVVVESSGENQWSLRMEHEFASRRPGLPLSFTLDPDGSSILAFAHATDVRLSISLFLPQNPEDSETRHDQHVLSLKLEEEGDVTAVYVYNENFFDRQVSNLTCFLAAE